MYYFVSAMYVFTIYMVLAHLDNFISSCFLAVFVIAIGFTVRYFHQRRMQERLQQEVTNLLYEYVPMDGYDIETVNFNEKSSGLLNGRHV